VTPCSLVGGYQRFGGKHCLHIHVLEVGTIDSSEKLVTNYKPTWCLNSEDHSDICIAVKT
jgi:hypothetical protein